MLKHMEQKNESTPLVTVITATYNLIENKRAKFIIQCLGSVHNQHYSNIEHIVIDGASNDGTLSLLREYESQGWIKLFSEPDAGIYDAMNKGIRQASGKLIGIVNSDDWYEKDTIENVVKAYQGNQYEVVYGMQKTYLNGKEKATFIYHHDFLPQQMITHPTCFVTKDVYEKFGVFDLQYKSAADYDFMLRLYQTKQVTFTPVMKILANFQLGGM